MDKEKKNELFITLIIPSIIAIILAFFQVYGKNYPLVTISIIMGLTLFTAIIYFCIKFLQDREERWKNNGTTHHLMRSKIETLEYEIILLKRDLDFNKKLNKLKKNIKYLEGKNEK